MTPISINRAEETLLANQLGQLGVTVLPTVGPELQALVAIPQVSLKMVARMMANK